MLKWETDLSTDKASYSIDSCFGAAIPSKIECQVPHFQAPLANSRRNAQFCSGEFRVCSLPRAVEIRSMTRH